MIVVQLLILGVLLIIAPIAVGGFFAGVEKTSAKIPFLWISGQILLWAVFQVVSVPLILLQQSFFVLVIVFSVVMVLLTVGGISFWLKKGIMTRCVISLIYGEDKEKRTQKILWLIFGLLLLLQLILGVFLAYEEGDDAFYVAISTIVVDSEVMYMKLPYTGGTTGLDARHGLAPFPVWVAYLAKMTGIPAVTVAQILLPLVLIVMTYGIYFLIGNAILKKQPARLPMFMIFVELMVLFGGYSVYSAENFLLVRTAQGKAVIANIIIPFLIYLWIRMLETLEKGEAIVWRYWVLAALTMAAGCLCSTLGTLLTCMLLGIVGSCAVVCYRKWKLFFPMACCCIVPVMFALLYFVL